MGFFDFGYSRHVSIGGMALRVLAVIGAAILLVAIL
jgi:hypothetical protein